MRKHKYNQGDVLQYHWASGVTQLLVILEVSNTYRVFWLDPAIHHGRKGRNSHKISTLDDADRVTLYARGQ
jgi:hypothetical protein